MSKLRVLVYSQGKTINLDGRVVSLKINGDIATCFRTCEVTVINAITLRERTLSFDLGKELRVMYDDKEIFRGIMFTQSLDTSGNHILTAHDYNVYLIKNADTVNYKNKTAAAILKDLCGKFGISTGNVADTGHVIKSHIARGKPLYEIVTMSLTSTFKSTGKKYRLISREGKVDLVLVKDPTQLIVIENGHNLMSAAYSESIEDLKTQIKLTGGDEKKPITAVESDGGASAKYGVMQHYEHLSDVKKASDLKAQAKQMLAELKAPKREFKVDALGDVSVTSGIALAVRDKMTGISGAFYVSADAHTFGADSTYTMSLQLTRTNDIPQMEVTS